MTPPIPVTHNRPARRFEASISNEPLAFLSYTTEGDRVVFDRTFVPESLRGQGVAAALARAALREAQQQGWRIEPRCSYVAGFIKRHSQFADLVV